MCPNNSNVFIYASGRRLYRTDAFFGQPLPTWHDNLGNLAPDAQILTYAFAPSDPDCKTYAFAVNDGVITRVYLTTDGGDNWNHIDGNQLPNRFLTDLAFGPTRSDVLYATFSGYGDGGHVYLTKNATGAVPLWSNITPTIGGVSLDIPFNTVAASKTAGVYFGTEQAVWRRRKGKWKFMGTNAGLPNVIVSDILVNDPTNRIVAFTYGRGAFLLAPKIPPSDAVTFVSDMTPLTPPSNAPGAGPIELDRSVGGSAVGDGATISLNGPSGIQTFTKGLGMRAPASTTYFVDTDCRGFAATVGIDRESPTASALFKVYLDDNPTPQFTSVIMDTGDQAVNIIPPISTLAASKITLAVEDLGGGAHVDWANAAICCGDGCPAS